MEIKLYRLKHKPTGLYYKPGNINLSTKGKIYTSNNNLLSYLGHYGTSLTIPTDSRIFKKYEVMFQSLEGKGVEYIKTTGHDGKEHVNLILVHVHVEDFEKEYINEQ